MTTCRRLYGISYQRPGVVTRHYRTDFAYDQAGQPYALTYNGATYYYILNAQGDVTALVNASGTPVAEYTYSPYGEVLTATGSMAQINPLRYRGYYYDTETGFYYLQSRYYDPVIGRFINADTYVSTGQGLLGYNMFAYCNNNPVNLDDNEGQFPDVVIDGFIHNRVLDKLCAENSALSRRKTCVYYNKTDYRGGIGFCDLYNVVTGEVWELKKNSQSPTCTTAAASLQLAGYISGRLKHHPELALKYPSETVIPAGSLPPISLNGYIYNVNYWYEGNGILRYDYTKAKTDARKAVEAVVTIGAVAAMLFLVPESAPAVVTALFA